jgi:hypothetical protein
MRNTLRLLVILWGAMGVSFGQTATASGLPQVVATFQRFNQTGPISMDRVWVPAESGIYRITVVMVVTVGNGQQNSAWEPTLSWVDENGEETYRVYISPQSTSSSEVTVSKL